jgi:membrane protease subunit HflK
MQESEGYRSRVVANAQGEANRFSRILVEYQKSPGIMRDRMYIEAMQQIFASTTKVMVDAKNNNSMIYLPLDKLIAQTAAESAAAYTAPVQTAPVEANPDVSRPFDRNRDARSSRDREAR